MKTTLRPHRSQEEKSASVRVDLTGAAATFTNSSYCCNYVYGVPIVATAGTVAAKAGGAWQPVHFQSHGPSCALWYAAVEENGGTLLVITTKPGNTATTVYHKNSSITQLHKLRAAHVVKTLSNWNGGEINSENAAARNINDGVHETGVASSWFEHASSCNRTASN